MGQWRTKLLKSIILYSAGFITAVYVLAPSPAPTTDGGGTGERYMWSSGTEEAGFSSQDRAATMRAGLDKVIRFAEDNAVKGIRAVKAQIDQRRPNSGQ